jgi:hypothetical protein
VREYDGLRSVVVEEFECVIQRVEDCGIVNTYGCLERWYFANIGISLQAASSGPTSIFIDSNSAYALLAPYAEQELLTIVRGWSYRCGDGGSGAYKSFACFCYESSAKFSSMIGAHVATQCPDDASQNTTAL